MTPDEVPDELAAILERAIYDMPRIELTGRIARVALAAVLPAHEAMVVRRAAERILLVSEISMGSRCPACHGKPAADRWRQRQAKPRFVCGCGHQWDLPSHSAEFRAAAQWSASALLRLVAASGELPPVPKLIESEAPNA